MTHEEEELQHDVSKLRDQVQQIFLSQRVTKNEMEAKIDGRESNMDGVEEKMEYFKDGLKADMDGSKENMEGLEEGLTKLLQERLPGGDNINP